MDADVQGDVMSPNSSGGDEPTATKWPFMFVVDDAGQGTNWVVLHAPIQSPKRKAWFAEYRTKGLRFVGMTSFMTFPRDTQSDTLDYEAICEGWCHCFREPGRFLREGRPTALVSLSDFVDPTMVDPERVKASSIEVPWFDFVYVAADEPWKMEAKNFELGRRCCEILCARLGLRGLVIGPPPGSIGPTRGLTTWPRVPYWRFLQVLQRARFLLMPSGLDASPRVMAEAMCLDVPLVVFRGILGGWKYVERSTGVLFDGTHDVTDAATSVLSGEFHPRAWWIAHHGPQRAGLRLRRLLEAIDPDLPAGDALGLSYEITGLSHAVRG